MRTGFALLTLLAAGCGPGAPQGIGYLRVSELDGACDIPEDPFHAHYPVLPTNLDYRRVHATTSFNGDSRWPGGAAIATGWQDADGKVGLVRVDVAPDRGYGPSLSPVGTFHQAVGYEEWKDGQRVFAATSFVGIVNYVPAPREGKSLLGSEPPPGFAPGALFLHVALTGVDAAGKPSCRIIGLHAAPDHARTERYDPSWLKPRPSMLIVESGVQDVAAAPPTFSDEAPPSTALVSPAAAPADPVTTAPRLETHAGLPSDASGDGSDSCD
jgi:hypothetical protein